MEEFEQTGEAARKTALPPIERYELDAQPRRRPNWTASQGELNGYAWIDGFSTLADDPETADCGFVERNVFFTVEHKQDRVAAGSLKIWRGVYHDDISFGLDTFVECGNRNSLDEYNTARSIAKLWGGKSEKTWWLEQAPFCFGDLCVFERLTIDAKTALQSRATWTIINSLLQRLCRREIAAIVLKAFPLEYEGNATKDNSAAFERRRRALVRLYQRRLRFELVSDPSLAREGWMLKLINDGADPDRLSGTHRAPRP
jgi:hypothetical protein